jgi:hypothetical protein
MLNFFRYCGVIAVSYLIVFKLMPWLDGER